MRHPSMEPLTLATQTLMGYTVEYERNCWVQLTGERTIIVPLGDAEGLLHELAHWVVASDSERQEDNLALDDLYWENRGEKPPRSWDNDRREVQAVYLSVLLFKACGLEHLIDLVYQGSGLGYRRSVEKISGRSAAWVRRRLAPHRKVLVKAVCETWGVDLPS